MKFFGHEFGKKAEAPANEAPVASAESLDTPAAIPQQEVAPVNPDAATMGAAADKLADIVASEAKKSGSLDRPAAPTDTPVSNEVVSAEIAAPPETEEPVVASAETFQVPQEVVPAPEVAPQTEALAPVTSQEVVPAPVEAPVTIDPIADATAAPESDELWKKFDAANTTAADASATVEAAPAVETPEQNQ